MEAKTITMNPDIVKAVQAQLGNAQDNLHRARAAFRGLSPQELSEQPYGESGRTRAQIVAGYEEEEARWLKALDDARG